MEYPIRAHETLSCYNIFMNKEEIILEAKKELQEIYSGFCSKGIIAIYLWGSITTEDFDTQKSDIDAIAVVDDGANLDDERIINARLQDDKLKDHAFKINFIYTDELNAQGIKGNLAKFVEPKLLLLDLPFWFHVAGEKIDGDNFKINKISPSEASQVLLKKIEERYFPLSADNKDYKYFLKALARFCYYIQQGDSIKESFSYSGLDKNKNDVTREVVEALLEIKSKDWDSEIFNQKLRIFESFFKSLK